MLSAIKEVHAYSVAIDRMQWGHATRARPCFRPSRWAVGVLQQIEDEPLAMEQLKLTIRKQVGEKEARKKGKASHKVYAQLWDTSAMDEAIDPVEPCKTFADHRHCQKLLDLRTIRDPHFAEAPVKVLSSAGPHDRVVNAIVRELQRWADRQNGAPSPSGGEPGSDAAPLPEPAVNS